MLGPQSPPRACPGSEWIGTAEKDQSHLHPQLPRFHESSPFSNPVRPTPRAQVCPSVPCLASLSLPPAFTAFSFENLPPCDLIDCGELSARSIRPGCI
ncbi:hypothetical protein VTJ04DRAFT_4446 [Mycothermus thermophilus]|uniref:uncharacterized protein n=1 Tax=Humicola insolens TaxID=85995 RepID=UPI0037443513